MKKVIIESPYAGNIEQNIKYARGFSMGSGVKVEYRKLVDL